jgi:transposase-like protein
MSPFPPHRPYCDDCGAGPVRLVRVRTVFRDTRWVCQACSRSYIYDNRNATAHAAKIKKIQKNPWMRPFI